ncbi:acetate--CoA ligase family protein [Leifsonia bigeumensis]|uniref:Acetate--CoA ligase family protein n=1 Tax=Leifsonella bigeumensis TaxID=433643 RepID=A0ABP7FEH1_9MICO
MSRPTGAALVDLLCEPTQVIVMGGSRKPGHPSARPVQAMLKYGFRGDIVVVNPNAEVEGTVDGVLQVRDLAAVPVLPGAVGMIAVRAEHVPSTLVALGERGVKAAVAIASGLESGAARAAIAAALDSAAAVRLIGPNCVGTSTIATGAQLNFSSVIASTTVRAGGIAIVTQSGAVGNGILQSLDRLGIGISTWFSTGNEYDAGALEIIAGVLEREDTHTVGVFLEGVTDQAWLGKVGDAIRSSGKRVYFVKAATSASGKSAAAGHTGRLVDDSSITTRVLESLGLTPVGSVSELIDVLVVRHVEHDIVAGGEIAVVSVSGASGVLAADRIEERTGLRLASADGWSLPATAEGVHVANPLDVPFLGRTDDFCDVVASVRREPGVDRVVGVVSSLAHELDRLPVVMTAVTGAAPLGITFLSEPDGENSDVRRAFHENGIATGVTVDRLILAISRSMRLADREDALLDSHRAADHHSRDSAQLDLVEGAAVMPELPWAPFEEITTAKDLARAGERLGWPVFLKTSGRTLSHRTELGAVRRVLSPEQIESSFAELASLASRFDEGLVAQASVRTGGYELLVAAYPHSEIGPVGVVRPGGVLAELLHGEEIVTTMDSAEEVGRRLREGELGPWLGGFRGSDPCDVDAVAAIVTNCVRAVAQNRLAFIELNPVIAFHDGATVVDAVMHRTRKGEDHD